MRTRVEDNIIILSPEPDMAITNGGIVSTSDVYLGKNDEPGNWWDCDIPDPEENAEATAEDYENALEVFGA